MIPVEPSGVDQNGQDVRSSMVNKGGIVGQVSYTRDYLDLRPDIHFFFNETHGGDMNQAIVSAEVVTVIHDGGDTTNADSGTATGGTSGTNLEDTGQNFLTTVGVGMVVRNTTDTTYAVVTAVVDNDNLTLDASIMADTDTFTVGAVWVGTGATSFNFASGAKVVCTSGNNNDTATFDNDGISDMQHFGVLTGKIDLDTYNVVNHDLEISLTLAAVLVGNTVNINDYIDTTDLAEQSFSIPLTDMGVTTQDVDALKVVVLRSGGSKPTFKLDDLQLGDAAGTATWFAGPMQGEKFLAKRLRFVLADNITEIEYDKFMGLAALANGVNLLVVSNGENLFQGTIKDMGGFFLVGIDEKKSSIGATNSWLVLETEITSPVFLDSSTGSLAGLDDGFYLTISDDLSTLLRFQGSILGDTVLDL